MKMKNILGIDLGGVIIKPAETKGDTSFFTDDYLQTPMFEDAMRVIRQLREERFGDNIYIVSKCGPKVQQKSLDWLEHHNFYASTGLKREHVHFCRKRPDKAPICKRLGITVFIDDRLDVLSHMTTVSTKIHFRGSEKAKRAKSDGSFRFSICPSWKEVADLLGGE
ncbi:MAG: hypothetical protein AAFY34_11120 [Pseudomonadota bacterium]